MRKTLLGLIMLTLFSISFLLEAAYTQNNIIFTKAMGKETSNGENVNENIKKAPISEYEASPQPNHQKSNHFYKFLEKLRIEKREPQESHQNLPIKLEDGFSDVEEWGKIAYVNENRTRVIVRVKETLTSLSTLEKLVEKHQATLVNKIFIKNRIIAFVVELPLQTLTAFSKEAQDMQLASYIEPNMKVQALYSPNDPLWNIQWGPQKIEADWAWNTTVGSHDILVAVIDTGIYYYHEDLEANYVALGYDWVNMDNDPIDDHGHGTHCAGIIAATINNGKGIAGVSQVRVMAEKVLDSWGYGYADWVANGIIHATEAGARIISMSLGGYGYSALLHEAVKYAYDHGVLLIAAAGNDNTNIMVYPAGYEEVIAVAATDQNDYKAWFSNWGDWIELAAPGVNIHSTVPWGYESWSGTSMACPHVSGVAALVWSLYPEKTREWLRLWLRYTADDLGAPGFDVNYGYGRINARKAVEQPPPAHELIAYELLTPPYVKPGKSATINATILNFGENNETNVQALLLANNSIVDSTILGFLGSGNYVKISLSWTPTVEGLYNLTFYIVPVPDETNLENNLLCKCIYVGFPVKAVVLHSAGNVYGEIITNWQTLNTQWYLFGDVMVYIDYTTLNKEDITYEDIASTEADVLIISCAYDRYAGWEFTDQEIQAISKYCYEGHGLIVTAGTFYYNVPNNNKLAPLFGLKRDIVWYVTGTDLLHLTCVLHPLFVKVPNPLVFPRVGTALPGDGRWDSNELVDGEYVAIGHFQESAIVVRRGLVYISPWLEVVPPYYHHHLQLLYNAITWSRFQKPAHELVVSLEAPKFSRPHNSTIINATVSNNGLNNETNVVLHILIDGAIVRTEIIPHLNVEESITISHQWTPTSEKVYNITVYAPPLPQEEITSNNVATKNVRVFSPIKAAVLGDYNSQLTNLLKENGINAQERSWDVIQETYNYDAIVVNKPTNPGGNVFQNFIEAADKNCVGLIFTSSWPSYNEPYGISLLQWYLGDPQGQGHDYAMGSVYYKVLQSHPIFEGLNVSDKIYIITGGDRDHAWFWGYSGQLLANVGADYAGIRGGGVACKITENGNKHLLLASLAPQYYTNTPHWTEEAKSIFVQGVLWVAAKPEHDISAILDAPEYLTPNRTVILKATVLNRGRSEEKNITLSLTINGEMANSTIIPYLPVGGTQTLTYSWTPKELGTYNITAYALPVKDEMRTANNIATKLVKVTYPLIQPREGQYANYKILYVDSTGGNYSALFNFTYLRYISPYQINVTLWIRDETSRFTLSGWMIVNIFNRLVERDSGIGWAGMWYPGLIETNVSIGSTINLLWGTATITASDIIIIEELVLECWEIRVKEESFEYILFYDQASGLWISMDVITPTTTVHLILTETNIPIGRRFEHDIAVVLKTPARLSLYESTIINATVYNIGLCNESYVELQLIINGTVVAAETITELASGNFYTLSFPWTPVVEGTYNVTAYAPPLISEIRLDNNVQKRIVSVALFVAALISDNSELTPVKYILDSMGICYDIYNDNSIYLYTANIALLMKYRIVIFYTESRWITPEEQKALDQYLATGGNLIVTGWDCLVSDTRLAEVVRSATLGDNLGKPNLYVVNAKHPIMQGPYGSFPEGYCVTDLYSDCDKARADEARGAVTVAGLGDGYDKIIATEGLPGKVVFWNGIGYYDWTMNQDCLAMFKNMINWMGVSFEHELTVSLIAPAITETGKPTLLKAIVNNIGLVDEANVELQLWINGSLVQKETVQRLNTQSTFTVSYIWTPEIEGTYNITAYAPPVLGEHITSNNIKTRFVKVSTITGTRVFVDPHLTIAYPLQTFSVKINVANVENMAVWQIYVKFDPKIVECVNVTIPEDNVFAGKTIIAPTPVINNNEGTILFGALTLELFEFKGNGTLCQIDFRSLTSGDSQVEFITEDLFETFLEDKNGDRISFNPINGIIRVIEGPPPIVSDVAINHVETSATAVYPGRIVNITVIAANLGETNASFNVSAYYNTSLIGIQSVFNLPPQQNITLVFVWNTTGLHSGQRFIIKAEATSIPGETKLDNNIFFDGTVKIKMLGDLNGDDKIDMSDVGSLTRAFGTKKDNLRWNGEADLNNDGKIDMTDVGIILREIWKSQL
ncbi:MAG: S8 family serine peptidase [Candidatus Bathyarchaeia archaeon]